ncbi:MAG: hypothetical protein ABUT39_09880 [Acidobacteriota bacterium]
MIRDGFRLFAAEQGYPWQNNLIYGETRLSAATQGYPGQNKVVGGKGTLRRDLQAFAAFDG